MAILRRVIIVIDTHEQRIKPFSSIPELENHYPEWNNLGMKDMFNNIIRAFRDGAGYAVDGRYLVERHIVNPPRDDQ